MQGAARWATPRESVGRAALGTGDHLVGPVVLLCLGQVLLWGLAFGLTYTAPGIDSAEQFVWAFSLENGYWKHPPMPSWIMHGLIQLFGPSVVLPFIATQASIAIAMALTWRLGCEFMSQRRSLVAMALTSLVAYHNIGGDCFNHNTALLPFQAATLLLFYRATRQGRWHQWALADLMAGLSMLVKYVALLPLAGLLLYFVLDRELHRPRHLAGLLLAAAVFALTLLPAVDQLPAERNAILGTLAVTCARPADAMPAQAQAQATVPISVRRVITRPPRWHAATTTDTARRDTGTS